MAPQVDVDVNALPPGLVCLPPGSNASPLSAVALSADGTLLAAGGQEGHVSHPASCLVASIL